jgi:hypothetical protein
VNICYDSHVPPPPPGSEAIIQRAMRGEELPGDGQGPEWFVPVVVSHPREDKDKCACINLCVERDSRSRDAAGKPSLVFDCVVHSSVKERVKDVEFKSFLMGRIFLLPLIAHADIYGARAGSAKDRSPLLHPALAISRHAQHTLERQHPSPDGHGSGVIVPHWPPETGDV